MPAPRHVLLVKFTHRLDHFLQARGKPESGLRGDTHARRKLSARAKHTCTTPLPFDMAKFQLRSCAVELERGVHQRPVPTVRVSRRVVPGIQKKIKSR